MKKLILLFLLFALLLVPASAHSGGTDANGGHIDHSTGIYHYHHGYSAHQHYDMDGDGIDDCPYQFDDKTASSSGSSSETTTDQDSAVSRSVSVPTTAAADAVDDSGSLDSPPSFFTYLLQPGPLFAICAILSIFLCLILFLRHKINDLKNQVESLSKGTRPLELKVKELKQEVARLNRAVYDDQQEIEYLNQTISYERQEVERISQESSAEHQELEQLRSTISQGRQSLKKLFSDMSRCFHQVFGTDALYAVAGAPEGDTVSSDLLPCHADDSSAPWGLKYTFYINPRSNKYHTSQCAFIGSSFLCNAYTIRKAGYIPCSHCNPKLPDMAWVNRYLFFYKNFEFVKNLPQQKTSPPDSEEE